MQNLGGCGANKVYYGRCENGELQGKLGHVLSRMVQIDVRGKLDSKFLYCLLIVEMHPF